MASVIVSPTNLALPVGIAVAAVALVSIIAIIAFLVCTGRCGKQVARKQKADKRVADERSAPQTEAIYGVISPSQMSLGNRTSMYGAAPVILSEYDAPTSKLEDAESVSSD